MEEKKDLIVIKQLPVIEEQLKTLSVEIDKKVEEALSMECTEVNKQIVKNKRTDLKNDFDELENRRKQVKNKILEPYESFEKIYKTYITEKFAKADKDLKEKIDSIEKEQKQRLEDGARSYFEELKLQEGIEFITFENINLKIGVSDNPTKLKKVIKTFIEKTLDDLNLINVQKYSDEILVEYMKSLNVSKSIVDVNDRHFILEQVKNDREIEKEKLDEQKQMIEKVDSLSAPVVERKEEQFEVLFKVRGTKKQLSMLKQFLENGGYDYE